MKKQFEEYYLGLDIGTDSVGWAVTNTNYDLLKLNKKTFWGMRLLEGGQTAVERRTFRAARRRLCRRVQRIKLLQELFASEIYKVDSGFYHRLNESKYTIEDRQIKQLNTLFCDENYKDKDYHKEFPTIYHLRMSLISNTKPHDVRLVYLAVHNILKHRGHFLFEGQEIKNITSFQTAYENLLQCVYDMEITDDFACEDLAKAEEILSSKKINLNNKKSILNKLFDVKTKQGKAIVAIICGSSVKLWELFEDDTLKDAEIKSITFSDDSFETKYSELEMILQERIVYLERLKAVYDWAILADILQGEKYISQAKVAVYEKHKKDLKILKDFLKSISKEKYDTVFNNVQEKSNYCAYIGNAKKNSKKQITEKICSNEDFCKFLNNLIGKELKESEDKNAKYLQEEIENKTFLPKQIIKENGTIPYQLHLIELRKIIDNAQQYLPFLSETDEDGFSIKQKIEELLKFRIPYYVGPLNDAHKENGNCWIVKKKSGKIYPWNFDEIVDKEASAEQFIMRMTNKCTYLRDKDVIPKNSLLYSDFMALNELNNLKINNERIPIEIKNIIWEKVYLKHKKVTLSKIKNVLKKENMFSTDDEISGVDQDIKISLTSYHDFLDIFTKIDTNKTDEIIKYIVLFGEDKKILKQKLLKEYPEIDEAQMKKILKLKYSGWGRLSKELLYMEGVNKQTGEVQSIIGAMRLNSCNLMELLSENFTYLQNIEQHNKALLNINDKLSYDIVEEMYLSPKIKRSAWQALQIVEEIKNITGKEPKKIFVEMTRGDDINKKRTKSRREQLIELYEKCKDETRDFVKELQNETDERMRSDRLYLYYTQMGKCMYSGKNISLLELFDKNIYDVDHIYPQSKTKDDSLNNKVLVLKTLNAEKSDDYPLSQKCRDNCGSLWSMLLERGFITKEKYKRLIRNTPLTTEELAGFINRQLVETSQSAKAVAAVLKETYTNSKIVYVKAGNVSDFRHKYNLLKVREVNDLHHAKDAYLNIVVGNAYDVKFSFGANFMVENEKYNLDKIFDYDIASKNVMGWIAKNDVSIKKVKEIMNKNNVLFTRYSFEKHGGFFDQNIMKKGKGQIPIKTSDIRLKGQTKYEIIDKYGGYNKLAGAYFVLVEHTLKNKRVKSFCPVYVLYTKKLENSQMSLEEYCCNILELTEPKVLLKKVKINTLFEIDGFKMHISGRTDKQLIFKNANQLCIGMKNEMYIKKVAKWVNYASEQERFKKEVFVEEKNDKISKNENILMYDIFLNKICNTLYSKKLKIYYDCLCKGKEKFENATVEEQCKFLMKFIQLFRCNPVKSDLTFVGGSSNSGILTMNEKIDDWKNAKIINQSVTGIFENEVILGE